MSRRHRPRRIPGMRSDRVLLVLPTIDDDLPANVKNALAIRNAASASGKCPDCGALGTIERVSHGVYSVTFRHEPDCGALTDEAA